jgi:hypothetical protein
MKSHISSIILLHVKQDLFMLRAFINIYFKISTENGETLCIAKSGVLFFDSWQCGWLFIQNIFRLGAGIAQSV